MKKLNIPIDLGILKACITGIFPKNLNISKQSQEKLVRSFIRKKMTLNEKTPPFILMNEKCILSSIKKDITSAKYIPNDISEELKKQIIEIALKNPFAVDSDYPEFLVSNNDIILNSVQIDSQSIDRIWWCYVEDEYKERIIEALVNNNYVLNIMSASELIKNQKVILASIKKDIESIEYAIEYENNEEIINYLFHHGYCSIEDLKDYPLGFLDSYEKIETFFNNMPTLKSLESIDKEKLSKLFYEMIYTRPTIESLTSIFEVTLEQEWKVFKEKNRTMYENIFGKICSELKAKETLEDVKSSLCFLQEMKDILGEKYLLMDKAMQEYFDIYHRKTENKLKEQEKYRDMIAKISALYISKSKEKYKDRKMQECYRTINDYFCIKKNHPLIQKEIVRQIGKTRFYDLYLKDDPETENFISSLEEKYKEVLSEREIRHMINSFVIGEHSKINQVFDEPEYYQDYLKYKKVKKLINRLNSNYISIDGKEVERYRHLISVDQTNNCYFYQGRILTQEELNECKAYEEKSHIFNKIKKEIRLRSSKIEIGKETLENIDTEILENKIPFSDEFYEFNLDLVIKEFSIEKFYNSVIKSMIMTQSGQNINEESYRNLHYILIEQGLFWLQMLISDETTQKISRLGLQDLNHQLIAKAISQIDEITTLSNRFHINICNFNNFLLLTKINTYVSEQSLGILEQDLAKTLVERQEYISCGIKQVIENASQLASIMVTKSKFTVPRVQGETSNYKYSLYDNQDFSIFLSGINTHACFRVNGIDNDFFNYCLLDKNGFILKIEDSYGNFIARAAGFRHGNYIFMNQLRSIYDISMNEMNGFYNQEREEIIETFKKACDDILITSKKNEKETIKIEYIFITQSYLLKNYSHNEVDYLFDNLEYPMDMKSNDWVDFKSQAPYLKESNIRNGFMTDFGNYPIICISSINERVPITLSQLKFEDVEPIYERKRNEIKIIEKKDLDMDTLNKINRISAIYTKKHNSLYIPIEIEDGSLIIIGDNWYITCSNEEITNSCVLEEDEQAKVEFQATYLSLMEELKNKKSINLERLVENKVYMKN